MLYITKNEEDRMKSRNRVVSVLLLIAVVLIGLALFSWKYISIQRAEADAANQFEPVQTITVAVAKDYEYQQTVSAIGTVLALRSITLRNEVPGTKDRLCDANLTGRSTSWRLMNSAAGCGRAVKDSRDWYDVGRLKRNFSIQFRTA